MKVGRGKNKKERRIYAYYAGKWLHECCMNGDDDKKKDGANTMRVKVNECRSKITTNRMKSCKKTSELRRIKTGLIIILSLSVISLLFSFQGRGKTKLTR